jgi:hypothetical protein
VVPDAVGKHRMPEDEPPQVPARTPFNTAEFFRPPPDAVGPVDAWGLTRWGAPSPQASERFRTGRQTGLGRPQGGGPGHQAPPGASPPQLPQRRPGTRPYPGSDAPRTRANPGATGPGPGRGFGSAPVPEYDPGPSRVGQAGRARRGLYAVHAAGPADLGDAVTREARAHAAAIRRAAEEEAAAIRQQASRQAAAIQREATERAAAVREAAEREAAELKSALLTMSGELGRAAVYVTQHLAAPGAALAVSTAKAN